MNLLNNANLIGRIVDESIQAQQISANSNIIVAYFKIAINKGFIDKQTKEWVDRTQFIPLKAFGPKASYIAKSFGQGDLISVNCEIDVHSKQDENTKEWTTYWSLIVQDIRKLGKPKSIVEASETQEVALKSLNDNISSSKTVDAELAKEDENKDEFPWELKV